MQEHAPAPESCSCFLVLSWWCGWCIRKNDPVHRFPIIRRDHLNRVPGTAIEKRSIRTFARALLAADTEIRIYFDSTERRMVFIGHPEHAGFDRTVLDTRR